MNFAYSLEYLNILGLRFYARLRSEWTELMIHATIRMKIPGQKVREALEILRSFSERTRVQPGCISSRIYRDVKEKHVIMIEEHWMTQEDLERHLGCAEYRNMLLVVEMSHEKPEIRFSAFQHSTGVETIEKARNRAG
jgi:quinol monooxygenase YgiN